MVRPRHLKLLAVLKQKCSVNLPAFLNSLLHDVARSMRKSQHVESVVSNHGMIRLIISHNLAQEQSSCEELIAMIEGGLTMPAPKHKHAPSTLDRPLKQRKSVRLARIRGRLESSQGNTSQPVEIHDSGDEKRRKRLSSLGRRRKKQSNAKIAHCKIHCKRMNCPKSWPIWANIPNLSAR